jgi:threonine/homoserine/homoserine lactone efflux protein
VDAALTFLTVAVLLTLAPGPATALVVRSAVRGGRPAALRAIAGNEVGVVTWAVLSVLGVSALVAASQVAYDALRLAGVVVLLVLGAQALVAAIRGEDPAAETRPRFAGFKAGLVTSLANPKLAVFFVALFPQFVPDGTPFLPAALAMAALVCVLDLGWYTLLAVLVSRSVQIARSAVHRWLEGASGAALLALGVRLALERR